MTGNASSGNSVDPPLALLAKHRAWWQRESLLVARVPTSPLGDLWIPLRDGTAVSDMDLAPHALDPERLAGPPQEPGLLMCYGDRIQTRSAYARIPWVEAILGCRIRATIKSGSMRAHPFVRDWSQWRGTPPWRDSPWFELLTGQVDLLVKRSSGRYAVTHTLMRGPIDLAEAVLGPELLCLSLYEHPAELERFLDEVTDVFLGVLQAQMSRVPSLAGGYVNPFGVWSPGTMVRTQCDASTLLSPEQYRRWFLPYDRRICQAVDHSIMHLHSGSLHTVGVLLEVERPHAIQISLDPEPSGPPLESLLPVFRRILSAKPLIVDGHLTESQIGHLLDVLPHGGLYVSARQTPD